MNAQSKKFNRVLLVILAAIYAITIVGFSYLNWRESSGEMEWWMTPLNALILSIPLVLLCGAIYVLVIAWQEHKGQGQLSARIAKMVYWFPRLAAILMILFMGLFSLDVFEIEASPLELLGGFLMHNIPSLSLTVILIFAWKRPAIGFVTFLAAAALFTAFFVRDIYALPNLLFFVLPLLLVAGLFYADWKWSAPQTLAKTDLPA